jgi:hypothetical protein
MYQYSPGGMEKTTKYFSQSSLRLDLKWTLLDCKSELIPSEPGVSVWFIVKPEIVNYYYCFIYIFICYITELT